MSRWLNRLTCLFLCLLLWTNALPLSALAAAEVLKQATADDELPQAIASGLAPNDWADQLNTPMAINDFCALTARVIESIDASVIPAWEELAKNALASTRKMKREDAMLAVYQAACLLGQGRDTTGDWGATDRLLESGDHFWELSWEYPEWTNLEEDAPFCTDCDKMPGGAYHFAQGQVSLISGKRVFDLDEENKDLHMLDSLTKGEGLVILQRFGESLQPQAEAHTKAQEQNDPAPDFVALSDASACTLNSDMLSVTAAMPALSIQRDHWRGTSLALDTVSWRTDHRLYRQEDCQAIADMGFNYVRLQVDCVQLLSEDGLIDRTILENIDNVIAWCASLGVHVNLDLHSVPGYGVGLSQEQKDILANPVHAALAEELWRMLAKRYKAVSAGALSFNLVNEPTAFDFTQEEYAALAEKWIAAIRESDPDKMILSDGMLSDQYQGFEYAWDGACPSMPVKLLDASVGQTIHLYPCFSHLESNYLMLESWPYEHMPVVAGMLHDDYALEVTGHFSKGTIIEFYFTSINGVNAGNTLVFGYNKQKRSIPMDGFVVGENNCLSLTTDDYGTTMAEFDVSNANGYTLRFELNEDTKKITLGQGKGSNLYANAYSVFVRIPTEHESTYMVPDNGNRAGFAYETASYETRYFAYRESLTDQKNVLHLEEKLPTAEHDDEGDSFDMETLRRYLQYWRDWADETGAFIMCNEFGIPIGFPQALRESYYRTLFALFEEYRIPWALYTNQYENWGPVVSAEIEAWNTLPADGSLTLKGDTYVDETLLAIIGEMDETADLEAKEIQEATKADTRYAPLGAMTITKDGHRYQTTGYRGDATGDIYVPSSTMEVLFGEHAEKIIQQEQKPYENLTAMCAQKQVSSYAYDDVLNAVYIWSCLYDNSEVLAAALREGERIVYYGLGEPSEDAITYQEFFAIMDKAVELANAEQLSTWTESFTDMRNSQATLTRFEGMVAILRMALVLGGEYSEFNDVDYTIIETIGESGWKQLDQITQNQQNLGNSLFEPNYPYTLGGFLNTPEAYDWAMTGVAYSYAVMRKSNVSGNTLFDYDKKENTMHLDTPLTKNVAMTVLARLLDSSASEEGTIVDVVPIDDERITSPNAAYLPNALLEQATDIANPLGGGEEKAFGAVLSEHTDISKDPLNLPYVEGNFRRYGNWGFNTVRYMIPYFKLFSDDASSASILMFEQLDQVVAYALEYKLHLNLSLSMLPGHWYREGEDYAYYGEFDLFLNKKRQEEAADVWRTIAQRYKDVPVNALSFQVVWETMNQNLSTGLPFKSYTLDDAKIICADLAKTVESVTPDRLAVYELENSEFSDDGTLYEYVQSKCNNSIFSLNYASMPFVYANMTAVEGEHIDNCNRSMFQSLYPVTYYDAQSDVSNEKPLILTGDLPAGTEVKLYISTTYDAGKMTVYADDELVYEESLPSHEQYAVTNRLSGYVYYAESDKCISITLASDVSEIRFENTSCCNWSGMAVTLQQEYVVKRWFTPSIYESFLENGEKNYDLFPYEKETSTILISPTIQDMTPITIHSDVSYSTDIVASQSNAETVDAWFKEAAEKYPGVLVRSESADFSGEYYSQVRYYEDVLASIQKYGLGFLTNDFSFNNNVFVDNEPALKLFMSSSQNNVPYENGWLRMDMFKVYQKYFPITILEDE